MSIRARLPSSRRAAFSLGPITQHPAAGSCIGRGWALTLGGSCLPIACLAGGDAQTLGWPSLPFTSCKETAAMVPALSRRCPRSCEILAACGTDGFADALLLCTHCRISRQHAGATVPCTWLGADTIEIERETRSDRRPPATRNLVGAMRERFA
ncbi:hypothetical protein B0T14DRAFT_2697 [Immersiella caudata]|uniref:Uncharacterized protein n=1 Tax=Immersiella caudata TaxID=314043 RepID=A0AA40CAC0_9PEZI|nr:hypothetical protein B0T14DRAFT_2697 [Immersiella caudata]